MSLYKIISIQHPDGTTRMDGRYPKRIGRTCIFLDEPMVGYGMHIQWLKNADGSSYHGFFHTSYVQQIERIIKRTEIADNSFITKTIVVTTRNSIYTFELIEGENNVSL